MKPTPEVDARIPLNLSVTARHEAWLEAAGRFASNSLAPIAAKVDSAGAFPHRTIRQMGEKGFLGLMVSPAAGGGFVSHLTYYGVLRLLAQECASHAMTLLAHSLCCKTIELFANERQKRLYLPKMARGEWLGAVAMTEPGAGSDLAGLSTTATKSEDGYVLEGHKHFITNGGVADIVVALAATAGREPPFHTSLFLLESAMTGFVVGKKESKLGFRGSDTRELFFDSIRLDEGRLLGADGKGVLQLQRAMESSRTAFSAMALGVAESAFGVAARHVKRAQLRRGTTLVQGQRMAIAEMDLDLECCRQMIRHAAARQDQDVGSVRESSMCKLLASEVAQRTTTRALGILGYSGMGQSHSVERNLRDARLFSLAEGTNEIQKLLIASHSLRSAR